LFIGSVYLLLSAVFGRWMAYLITMVALTGWLMIMSSMWLLGYKAQGPTTPLDQGPRGSESSWLPISASLDAASTRYQTFALYHDKGTVPRYSLMFFVGSVALFGAHLPLLDRAEKKRKEFLTGGDAPPWYGPA